MARGNCPGFILAGAETEDCAYTLVAMTHKQTRKSISISGELYRELEQHCQKTGDTKSGIVEREIRKVLGMHARGTKVPETVQETAPSEGQPPSSKNGFSSPPPEKRKGNGNVFTF